MTCNNSANIKNNEATRDVTKAILSMFLKEAGEVPYGNNTKLKVSINMVKDIDFYEQEIPVNNSISDENEESILPAIVISLPQLEKSKKYKVNNLKRVIENDLNDESGLLFGYEFEKTIFLDHVHRIKLIANDIITLQVMMRQFVNIFQTDAKILTIEDKLNGIITTKEVIVDRWPDAFSGRPNDNGYYDAEAAIKVEGVEYLSSKFESFPVVKDYSLVVVGVDQDVSVSVKTDGEVIIKID